MIKYIFCISPGRCGTHYLAELLARAQGVISIHEGLPVMNGEPMIQFNQFNEAPLRALTHVKWTTIQKASRGRVYCETNHSFIKGWGWLVPDSLAPQEEIGVVVLRRNSHENAMSMLRIRDVPGISEFSRTWYLSPWAPRNIESAPRHAGLFERCQWHIDETYRRAEVFRNTFPNIRFWNCELAQLNDPAFVERMLAHFGLKPTARINEAVGRHFNVKDAWPRWSKEKLLDLPNFPNPDEWSGERRDALLSEMVRWLRDHGASSIAELKPDPVLFGSIATAIPKVVAESEPELEKVFRIRLRFTETEQLLLGELLHSINPRDFAFLAIERSTEPHVKHRYDFNFQLTLGRILKRIGIVGVLVWARRLACTATSRGQAAGP